MSQTDPARSLIHQLVTAIEAESRERTISHDLMCSYIKACDYLAQPKPVPPTEKEIAEVTMSIDREIAWALNEVLDGVKPHDLPDQLGCDEKTCRRIIAACDAARDYLSQPQPGADGPAVLNGRKPASLFVSQTNPTAPDWVVNDLGEPGGPQPVPTVPTEEELAKTAEKVWNAYKYSTDLPYFLYTDEREPLMMAFRAILSEHGNRPTEPVMVVGDFTESGDLPPRVGHILRLAEIIREVDGNNSLGASALAEAILSHSGSRWSPESESREPASVAEQLTLTDDQLDILVIAIQALPGPKHPETYRHDSVDQGREMIRRALARWGNQPITETP